MERGDYKRSYAALNWLNFFAADVATGVGPFLAVYLSGHLRWKPGLVGLAMSAMSFSMVVAQSPAGWAIDQTRQKRTLVIGASMLMGLMGFVIPFFPSLSIVLVTQVLMGIAGAFYGPALIALAACLVRKNDFDRTIGKNQMYNHAGNVLSAVLIGVVGLYTGNAGVFYCLLALALLCVASALSIRRVDIDHPKEIGNETVGGKTREGLGAMFRNQPFLIFLLAAFVFHFANAAMLPLVGQEISQGKARSASLYMSACIVIAQLVMVPVTYWSAMRVRKGRKALLLVAFIVLPVRGMLYTLSTNAVYMVSVQLLDGVAAGIFGVVSILVVADLTGDSGKASLAQGMLATAVGLGASLSNLVTGYVVEAAGFRVGFLGLSTLAVAALLLLWMAMPETLKEAGQRKTLAFSGMGGEIVNVFEQKKSVYNEGSKDGAIPRNLE